jgi:hypothetical protein
VTLAGEPLADVDAVAVARAILAVHKKGGNR